MACSQAASVSPPAIVFQNIAEIEMSLENPGSNRNRPTKHRDRLLQLPLAVQGDAQIVRLWTSGLRTIARPHAAMASSSRPFFVRASPRLLCASAYSGFKAIAWR